MCGGRRHAARREHREVWLKVDLEYYWQARAANELAFFTARAQSLHILSVDCAAYKEASTLSKHASLVGTRSHARCDSA